AEPVRQQIGGCAGRDDHGHHQQPSYRLHGRDRAGRQQDEEQALGERGIDAHRARMVRVEERDHQGLPAQQQHQQRDAADGQQLHRVGRGDRQDVAQDDGLDADRCRGQRDHEQAQAEEGGEHDADDDVLFQPGALVQQQHGAGRQQPRD
ncbi:hypothetical protein BAGA_14215, partial [Bacillus gaemokensis]